MCTLNVKMDDRVVNRMKPLFDGDKAMNRWIEAVLHRAMVEYADEAEAKAERTKEFMARIEKLKNEPAGLLNLGGILGKPREDFSWDELREEAVYDKYGI